MTSPLHGEGPGFKSPWAHSYGGVFIGTQKVRRIGSEVLENNESHTELPELPENLKPLLTQL